MSSLLCPDCRAPMSAEVPGGLCPHCLLRLALVPAGETVPGFPEPASRGAASRSSGAGAVKEAVGSVIGRYRLLEPIGEGGFGIVWMAEQLEPVERRVALKILKPGMDTREVVARFEAERQALALMDHPNIARVFDGGATESGRPFFVMELVKGVRLTDYCDARRLGTSDRLRLFVEVCRAVQHAHQKGIIHRDLKPNNVLVTEHDGKAVPKVIDFGIAKASGTELSEKTLFTQFNQVMGTPAYMSPEQAGLGSLDIDTRSDIYALGILLYELLTGRPPFSNEELRKAGLDAILRTIRETEPPKPSTRLSMLQAEDLVRLGERRSMDARRLAGVIRGELDWIVMKCLEKNRTRRYETANGLARDIERFLNREPIAAAPPGVLYLARKLAGRYRTALVFVGVVLLVALVGTVVSVGQAMRASRHASAERHLRQVAETNESILRQTIYAADMALVAQALERGDDDTARRTLGRYWPTGQGPDLRGWDWRHLWSRAQGDPVRRIPGHTNTVTAIAFLGGGARLLSAGYDGTIREWDFASGRELRRWDLPGHRWRGLAVHPSETNVVSFAVDENLMVQIDLVSSRTRYLPVEVSRTCYTLLASPDGQAYLHGAGGWGFTSTNSTIVVRDAAFEDPLALPESGSRAAFSPDGTRLVTGTWLDRLKIWTWPDLEPVGELGPVRAVATLEYSPDGRRILAGGQSGELTVWDVETGTEVRRQTGHSGTTIGVARFSPDGRTVATAGGDQTIALWEAEALKPIRVLRGRLEQVWQVRWAPDGRSLVSTTFASGLCEWSTNPVAMPSPAGVSLSRPAHFSPDSRQLAIELAVPPGVAVWSMSDGRELAKLSGNWLVHGFVADGRTLVVEDRATNRVEFRRMPGLDLERATVLEALPTTMGGGMCRVMSRDGRMLVQCRESGWMSVWDLATGRLRHHAEAHRGGVRKAVFSADGRWLLSCGTDKVARLWDLKNFQPATVFTGEANMAWDVVISPDSTRAVVGWMNGTYRVYELATGRMLVSFNTGEGALSALPGNGQTLVTVDGNRQQLRFWNLIGLRESGTLATKGSGQFLTLSPDETTLVTENADRTLSFWRAPPLHSLAPD